MSHESSAVQALEINRLLESFPQPSNEKNHLNMLDQYISMPHVSDSNVRLMLRFYRAQRRNQDETAAEAAEDDAIQSDNINCGGWSWLDPIKQFVFTSTARELKRTQEVALDHMAIAQSASWENATVKSLETIKSLFNIAETSSNISTASYPDIRLDAYKWAVDSRSAADFKSKSVKILMRSIGGVDAHFHWQHARSSQRELSFVFKPERGILKRGESIEVDVGIEGMAIGSKWKELLVMDVRGGYRVVTSISSSELIFGVYPHLLKAEQLNLNSNSKTVFVPEILQKLRNELVRRNGLLQEGIFRVAACASEKEALKSYIDMGTMDSGIETCDVYCLAELIKLWFREIPEPLLTDVPVPLLSVLPTGIKLRSLLEEHLSEEYLNLFEWSVDLFIQVAQHQDSNRMSPMNCSIVFCPNLLGNMLEGLEIRETATIMTQLQKSFQELIEIGIKEHNAI